jgi:hypothetical protein
MSLVMHPMYSHNLTRLLEARRHADQRQATPAVPNWRVSLDQTIFMRPPLTPTQNNTTDTRALTFG